MPLICDISVQVLSYFRSFTKMRIRRRRHEISKWKGYVRTSTEIRKAFRLLYTCISVRVLVDPDDLFEENEVKCTYLSVGRVYVPYSTFTTAFVRVRTVPVRVPYRYVPVRTGTGYRYGGSKNVRIWLRLPCIYNYICTGTYILYGGGKNVRTDHTCTVP